MSVVPDARWARLMHSVIRREIGRTAGNARQVISWSRAGSYRWTVSDTTQSRCRRYGCWAAR
jgi:hypothetical protein